MAFTIATTTKKNFTLYTFPIDSLIQSETKEKQAHSICLRRDKIRQYSEKMPEITGGKRGGGNTARVNKTSSHISGDTTERLISIEARCQADREKQRRLIWSALIISRAADFLSFGPYSHSAIRAEAANRGRNIKSFQAALTQWELAELRN